MGNESPFDARPDNRDIRTFYTSELDYLVAMSKRYACQFCGTSPSECSGCRSRRERIEQLQKECDGGGRRLTRSDGTPLVSTATPDSPLYAYHVKIGELMERIASGDITTDEATRLLSEWKKPERGDER